MNAMTRGVHFKRFAAPRQEAADDFTRQQRPTRDESDAFFPFAQQERGE